MNRQTSNKGTKIPLLLALTTYLVNIVKNYHNQGNSK